MDEDELPVLGDGVDRFKVRPMVHKRTLTFVNHFVSSTASFLNHFATTCEDKLDRIAERLERLEVTVSLLENKLESIDGLDTVTADGYTAKTVIPADPRPFSQTPQASVTTASAPQPAAAGPSNSAPPLADAATQPPAQPSAAPAEQGGAPPPPPPPPPAGLEASVPAPPPPPAPVAPTSVVTVRNDARYSKYVRMIEIGAPLQAVMNKFKAETGMDPSPLENPDGPVPDGGAPPPAENDDFSSDDDDDEQSSSNNSFSEESDFSE